jgi:Tfp pilus assembly protein PilV
MNKENRKLHAQGFTLVELLVAATIAVLCITSVVAMLIKGREIDVNDRYRRYARALVVSEFEDPQYNYIQYVNLLTKAGTTTKKVTIDTRGAESDIEGVMTTTIGAETLAAAAGGMNLPYIPVTISINWTTSDGNDMVTLTKLIAQITVE